MRQPCSRSESGGPVLQGNTMSERREHFLAEYDWMRTGLMFEPRGRDMMSGSILYPPPGTLRERLALYRSFSQEILSWFDHHFRGFQYSSLN